MTIDILTHYANDEIEIISFYESVTNQSFLKIGQTFFHRRSCGAVITQYTILEITNDQSEMWVGEAKKE